MINDDQSGAEEQTCQGTDHRGQPGRTRGDALRRLLSRRLDGERAHPRAGLVQLLDEGDRRGVRELGRPLGVRRLAVHGEDDGVLRGLQVDLRRDQGVRVTRDLQRACHRPRHRTAVEHRLAVLWQRVDAHRGARHDQRVRVVGVGLPLSGDGLRDAGEDDRTDQGQPTESADGQPEAAGRCLPHSRIPPMSGVYRAPVRCGSGRAPGMVVDST